MTGRVGHVISLLPSPPPSHIFPVSRSARVVTFRRGRQWMLVSHIRLSSTSTYALTLECRCVCVCVVVCVCVCVCIYVLPIFRLKTVHKCISYSPCLLSLGTQSQEWLGRGSNTSLLFPAPRAQAAPPTTMSSGTTMTSMQTSSNVLPTSSAIPTSAAPAASRIPPRPTTPTW